MLGEAASLHTVVVPLIVAVGIGLNEISAVLSPKPVVRTQLALAIEIKVYAAYDVGLSPGVKVCSLSLSIVCVYNVGEALFL